MSEQVVQAYRFALDLTPAQGRDLARHAGVARLAHNWGLARIKANLAQRQAERSYGIAEADLTPSVNWSLYGLCKAWNQAKNEVAPWWGQCSKEACNTGLDQLARGLKNWSDSRKGNRKGKPVGFCRFKSKRKATPSVKFTTGTLRLEEDRKHITLPKVGTLKTHESTRKLARHVADAGFAEVRRQLEYKTAWRGGALVVADRWFASSKTCSGCGAVKAKLALSERTFVCTECGLVLDRGLNAAHNLAALVEWHVAGGGSETQNGRGADRETGIVPAGGCEASAPHREPSRIRRGLSSGNGRIIESH